MHHNCELANNSCRGSIHSIRIGDRWVQLCDCHLEMSGLRPMAWVEEDPRMGV